MPQKDQVMAAPLMKRTIKQGKFSRIFIKNVNKQQDKTPNGRATNYNDDITFSRNSNARRGSELPVKQPTLDEYMKKYENQPPEEKYSMSVPPSNKTQQMMNS